ncbi:MAG: diacylglycerol/lipid kinase family protein [Candidatus Cyclobacteriaceae bacterium M3_2C_046]
MDSQKNILFIINPIAGNRKHKDLTYQIENRLDPKVYNFQIAYSISRGHAPKIVKKEFNNYDAFVAVGGDGTVNEIGSLLVNSSKILGIIPNGSGNGLARELKIPLNHLRAIETLNQFKIKTIDTGLVNDRPFFCTSGVGFDAHIGKLFAKSKTRGFQTYFKTVVMEFFNYHPLSYQVRFNGTSQDFSAFAITIANAKQYGNNAYIAPQALINDGLLDYCLLKPFPRIQALNLGLRLFNKSIDKSPFIYTKKISEVEISCENADCYHLDGEHYALNSSLVFKTLPNSLKVLVP